MRRSRKNNQAASNGATHDASAMFYQISVVAEMVETHPQTLRMYERAGLISPERSGNNVRLYSEEDVARVRRIQHLTQELGVNLAGVEVVFKLLNEMEKLRAQLGDNGAASTRDGDGDSRALVPVATRAAAMQRAALPLPSRQHRAKNGDV
jgi:MerR family transcriptional regulator/heat shock protein HspR